MIADKTRALILCGLVASTTVVAVANVEDHDKFGGKADKFGKMQAQLHARARAQVDMQQARKAMADAKAMLAKSMLQASGCNVVAIVTKVGECVQKVKIEQRGGGGQLSTVLQPLSMQNVTLFTKGSKSLTYLPDQRIVVEVEGDLEALKDIEQRAELAAQNYDLRFMATAPEVAGRATYCVVAEPKVKGIPARQFFLDQETLYPLRFTQATDDGWRIYMDTQVVNFPKEMPQLTFSPVGTPRKVKFAPAQPIKDVRRATDRLGFEPVIPKDLPYGFTVQRQEIRTNQDGQLAMLWLTDGLATARVYEFRSNQLRDGIWSRGSQTVLTEDGITMVLDSELKQGIRKKLLNAFATRKPQEIEPPSMRSASFGVKPPPVPSEEPGNPKSMFKLEETEPVRVKGSVSSASSTNSVSPSQANNVKGE